MQKFLISLFIGMFGKYLNFSKKTKEEKQTRAETPIEADKASQEDLYALGQRVKDAMKEGDQQ